MTDHSPRVLALANQKARGKTTTAINLGTALAAVGERVLISTSIRRATPRPASASTEGSAPLDLRRAHPPGHDARSDSGHRGAAPAHRALDDGPLGLRARDRARGDRAYRLRDAVATLSTGDDSATHYTYVLVDCPPSLNLVTVNAMAAAHSILVPLQCEFFALEGLSQLLKTVEQVKTSLNPGLTIHGIVLTMFDARNNLSGRSSPTCAASWARKVYDTIIPRNVRISKRRARQAGTALRSQMRRQPGLCAARLRDHPARAPTRAA